eukprot:104050_1
MATLLLSFLWLHLYVVFIDSHLFFGHVPIPSDRRPSFIRDESQIAENRLNVAEIPDSIDWRNHDDRNYMSWTRNQHIPYYCGSCWAFAATNSLAARIMISRGDIFPQISLSPQLVLDCDKKDNYGCDGGDSLGVFAWFQEFGAVEDSCNPYVSDSWYTNKYHERVCDKYSYCSYCDSPTDIHEERLYRPVERFFVDEFGFTEKGELAMMKMLTEGPIACAMAVSNEFFFNYTGGIFIDTTNDTSLSHEVAVIGYGTDAVTGIKFWIAMNSWGSAWGEHGYFRIIRGVNNLAIEEYCSWATVLLEDPTELDSHEMDEVRTQSLGGGLLAMKSDLLANNEGIQTSPLPEEYLQGIELPTQFGWFDIDGHNLLNNARQINKPFRCKACWAFVITDIISERLNVMAYLSGNIDDLQADLSPQVLINMDGSNGDCEGGYAGDAMQYLFDVGVPDETCQNYMAQNNPHPENEEYNVCYTCSSSQCWTVEPDEVYTVQEYGYVQGTLNMKREIYARGPIGCGMFVDKGFERYSEGIYASKRYCNDCKGEDIASNYIVSIVGWGYDEDEDVEYWIGKNNWGFGWGEKGYFRMQMGINSNNIEEQCIWGIPTFEDELEVLLHRMNDLITTDANIFSLALWVPRLAQMSLV